MFHRIKPSENSTEQKAIKSHFLATAKDTTHQNGIIGLFTMFHGLLVGKGLSIYGPKRASIFEIDQSLCSISELIHLEMAILSLFSQMNFVYGQDHDKESQEDLRVLQNWQKELRMEQIQQIRKNCNTK